MGRILIGTTSWTEKTLIESGRFYPEGATTAEARLRYYAGRFPLVEVDSSYYALPAERNARLWVQRTPEGFTFDVKAFRLFTHHQTPPAALPKDVRRALGPVEKKHVYYRDLPEELLAELWARFRAALEPLREAGKLGVVLLQFPPWFVYRRANLAYLAECARRLEGRRVAVELRHRSWLDLRHRDEVLAFERDHELAHVVVDGPQGFASSVPPVWEVTRREIAVVRLHGRNRETWEKKGLSAAQRFRYLYSEEELEELAAPIRGLAAASDEVHVLFNNCYRDFAQRNAVQLARWIGEPPGG
ncbi:MAG: DUF72 domain-containing protein [Deferrisomatales bacterium]